MASSDDPVTHYERVTQAWRFVLGEDFHYGYFRTDDEPLDVATDNLTRLMAEKGAIGRDTSVLDVGCGIGNPACLLAERYGCRVTGISTSPTGVEHAGQRARERGCADRVTFRVADGMDNRLPDASFDRVWVLESSHLMPKKNALFAECARVLRPGGRLVLCDIVLRRSLPLADVLSRSQEFLHLHYAFGRAKMETPETYRQLAERAGLLTTEVVDISDQTFPTFAQWRARLQSHEDTVRGLIGQDGLEHLLASCDVLPALWTEKIFGYALLVAVKP